MVSERQRNLSRISWEAEVRKMLEARQKEVSEAFFSVNMVFPLLVTGMALH